MFIDLDSFKNINDTIGHEMGDTVLQRVAEQLSVSVRRGDTVCRFGGDGFTVIFPNITHREDLIEAVERIMSTLKKPFTVNQQLIEITASIGIAMYPQDGKKAEELLKNADLAMYVSKERGRNRYIFFLLHGIAKNLRTNHSPPSPLPLKRGRGALSLLPTPSEPGH